MTTEPQETRREKYWRELNNDERTNKLRLEVKLLKNKVSELCDLVAKLQDHSHNSYGTPVVRIQESRGPCANYWPDMNENMPF